MKRILVFEVFVVFAMVAVMVQVDCIMAEKTENGCTFNGTGIVKSERLQHGLDRVAAKPGIPEFFSSVRKEDYR